MECETNLRKAKQAFMVRCEEYDKAKTAFCKAEEEGGGSTAKSLDKKKRLEEEARNKVLNDVYHCMCCFRALSVLWGEMTDTESQQNKKLCTLCVCAG